VTAPSVPAVVAGLCDDAAVFPPGRAALPDAVRAHRGHAGAWYAALVGPLVLPADALPRLGPLLRAGEPALPLSVTLPGGPAELPGVLAATAALPVELRSVEVAVPDRADPGALLDRLDGAADVPVYVEVPRDARRAAVLAGLPGRFRATFRTGGMCAELHPDEAELVALGVVTAPARASA
jgi:hypothetical protein